MIFVTVGTYKGDELIRSMDELAPHFEEEIIAQIGHSEYEPQNCKFFRFAPSLDGYYENASVVVGQGGVGTMFDLLKRGARFIGVSSSAIPDRHQNELLEKLSDEGYIMWCKSMNQLKICMDEAKRITFKQYTPPSCSMEKVILDCLDQCT